MFGPTRRQRHHYHRYRHSPSLQSHIVAWLTADRTRHCSPPSPSSSFSSSSTSLLSFFSLLIAPSLFPSVPASPLFHFATRSPSASPSSLALFLLLSLFPHLPPLPFPDMAIRLISVPLRRSGFFTPSLVSRQEQRSCDIALFCYINKTKHFTGDTPWVKNENSNRFTLKKHRYLNGYPAKHRHRNVSYRLVVDQTRR